MPFRLSRYAMQAAYGVTQLPVCRFFYRGQGLAGDLAGRIVSGELPHPRSAGGVQHRRCQVCHEIARPFGTKRIGDRRLEAEHRKSADWRENEFKCCFAWRGCNSKDSWLRLGSAESRNHAVGEAVEVAGRNVNVSRIVLRAHRRLRGSMGFGHSSLIHTAKIKRLSGSISAKRRTEDGLKCSGMTTSPI